MSRFNSSKGVLATPTMTNADGEEQCPICKTLRYMNRNMTFLINTCYHPLCNNCVDRLFEHGPNQCPYVNCHQTLRKRQFREPKFADLDVEREVDIRRRVAAVFNQPQDDFEDLRAYNDHLDMVESLTMDLVYGDDRAHAAAETKLKIWEDQNHDKIDRNRRQGERQREQTKKHLVAEQKAAAARRAEQAHEEEEERRAKLRQREADLDMLAAAPVGMANKVLLKKRGQERQEAQAEREAAALRRAAAAASGEFTIKGLKKKPNAAALAAARAAAEEDRGPYQPFGKVDLKPSRYALRTQYPNAHLDTARTNKKLLAGGYRIAEYYSRALFEAFAGLAVFVADEKDTPGGVAPAETAAAAAASNEEEIGSNDAAAPPDAKRIRLDGGAAMSRSGSGNGNGAPRVSDMTSKSASDLDGDVKMADAGQSQSLRPQSRPSATAFP